MALKYSSNTNVAWNLQLAPSTAIPIDNRTVVATLNDLTKLETWGTADGTVVYKGLQVFCEGNNTTYVYTGEDNKAASVVKVNNWATLGGNYTIVKKTSSDESIATTYELQLNNEKIGDSIDIPKDSSLRGAEVTTTNAEGETGNFLKLTYGFEDGSQKDLYVNFNTFVAESNIGDGLEWSDNKIQVKLPKNTEDCTIYVDDNGYLQLFPSIAEAILTAKETSDTTEYDDVFS